MDKQLDHYEVMARKNEISFTKEIILILDDLKLLSNIAGIFRLSDGLQVAKIILLCNEDFVISKKFRSIARIHENHINYEISNEKQVLDSLQKFEEEGYHITALEFTDHSKPLTEIFNCKKHILIAGSEKHGIRKNLLKKVKQSVHIPMQGAISSLNVMQAVSIAVYEIRRSEFSK